MTVENLLPPSSAPITLIDAHGHVADSDQLKLPDEQTLVELYRAMVVGRRFDAYFDRRWNEDETPATRLVLIGQELDAAALRDALLGAVV